MMQKEPAIRQKDERRIVALTRSSDFASDAAMRTAPFRFVAALSLFALGLLAACEPTPDRRRAGPRSAPSDAAVDGSVPMPGADGAIATDGGAVDSGLQVGDAGGPDAGARDGSSVDASSADAGAPSPDAGGLGFPTCKKTCNTVGDCVTPQSALFDADNWACTRNRCEHLGCHAGECSAGQVCVSLPNLQVPVCAESCSTPVDCATPPNVLFDADNYDCVLGACVWTGCNTPSECTATYASPAWDCFDPGLGTQTCVQTCSAVSQCGFPGSPGYDADNFDCTAGRCIYRGCTSTNECVAAVGAGYVCE